MKKISAIIVFVLISNPLYLSLASDFIQKDKKQKTLQNIVRTSLDFCVQQSLRMAHSLQDKSAELPKTADAFGNLQTCNSSWWTSGFFPGILWYLYEHSGEQELQYMAREYSARVENQKFTTDNHDVGFIIFNSFGNGYRITHDTAYLAVVYAASKSLYTRFNPLVSCIRSWDYAEWNKQWSYPVIIDNMMNLEMLMWTASEFHETQFSSAAVSHANRTMKEHYRPDYSCYHVVSYDTITGKSEHKQTSQGYGHKSAWARGQTWGLYGFTMMYRFTKDT